MYIITAIGLFWAAWITNKKWGKHWWLPLSLAALGSLALAASAVGGWMGSMMMLLASMVAGMLNSVFGGGVSATMILGVFALIGTIVIVADVMVDHTCNKYAIASFVLTPVAAMYAGGIIGSLHAGLRDAGSGAATGLVGALIGG
ncbi:hypothetical protein ABZ635_07240 [Nocardiopsis sp. NPDC007018]|uniref:hypothetical protein n=1 Tax=Nocardiopsis sp. NPDC007018 TaxID=3155721 RepID=UPI0033F8A5D5